MIILSKLQTTTESQIADQYVTISSTRMIYKCTTFSNTSPIICTLSDDLNKHSQIAISWHPFRIMYKVYCVYFLLVMTSLRSSLRLGLHKILLLCITSVKDAPSCMGDGVFIPPAGHPPTRQEGPSEVHVSV